MTVDDLPAAMTRLGLEPDEATLYVHLTRCGPARAGAVADALRFTRQNVYRLLDRLQQRGLVGLTAETPRRYEARPVDGLFDDQLRQLDDRRAELDALRAPVTAALAATRGETPSGPSSFEFALLRGRDRDGALARLLGDARRDVLLISTPSALHPLFAAPRVRQALGRLAAEGRVAVRAAVDVEPTRWPVFAALAEGPACAIRRLADVPPMQFVLVDERALYVTTAAPGDHGDGAWDAGLVTTVPALGVAHRVAFEALWARATELVLPQATRRVRHRHGGADAVAAAP